MDYLCSFLLDENETSVRIVIVCCIFYQGNNTLFRNRQVELVLSVGNCKAIRNSECLFDCKTVYCYPKQAMS